MTEKLQQTLRDSKVARWIALLLVSLSLLTGYFFADVMSPLKTMLVENDTLGWNNEGYGWYAGAYSWFNVIFLMLIFGGIILDRMGIRFTGTTFIVVMIAGAGLNYYALTDAFINHGVAYDFLNSFWTKYSPSVKMSALGYALFGVGVEILGITGSRMVVKWFKGKEMAFAMALQVALSRLGMFWVMYQAPRMAGEEQIVSRPVAFGAVLLVFGLAAFILYVIMDAKLDKEETIDLSDEEEDFKLIDVAKLITNKAFLYIAVLCVLFYSAVFPFMKYAPDLMVNKFGVLATKAGDIPGLLPIGSMILTPVFGLFLDYRGKSASIMILGSLLLIIVHFGFAFGSSSPILAIGLMILLGIAFSLVPAAMWPAVPKIVKEQYLGSAYAVIFYIQNIGLWLYPMIIGSSLESSNPGVTQQIKDGIEGAHYDYTNPMLIFALTGFVGLLFAFLLKHEDKKKGYGLELPNKTK